MCTYDERKEKEKQLALDQAINEALLKANSGDSKLPTDSNGTSINSSISDKFAYDIESKEKLLSKLLPGLTQEKVVTMMTVRKGKSLLRRIMPHIADHPIRWNIWIGVFVSLQTVLKKDKDDSEGTLYSLYPEFKRQIQLANFETVVRIAYVLPLADKKILTLFSNKFCISSLVAIILQAEKLFAESTDATLNELSKNDWTLFLEQLSTTLNRTIQNHTVNAAIESDAIQPMIKHFSRFKEIKLDPLLTLCSQAGQHVK